MISKPNHVSNAQMVITLLGEFTIKAGKIIIKENDTRQRRVWLLLAYLLTNRQSPPTSEELCRVLWLEDENKDPEAALKNLVYRLRTMLVENGIVNAKDLIVREGGSYRWNNKFACLLDTEEMERLYKLGTSQENGITVRKEALLKALTLYKGNFLKSLGFEEWVVPLQEYYRELYTKTVSALIGMFMRNGEYELIEHLSKHALKLYPTNVVFHKSLLRSLVLQEKKEQLKAHKIYAAKLLGGSNEIELIGEMDDYCENIYMDTPAVEETDQIVESKLRVFYCEPDSFKELYKVEVGAAKELRTSFFLVTILIRSDSVKGGLQRFNEYANVAMDILCRLCNNILPIGSIFTKSENKMVIMVSGGTFEECLNIFEHIKKKFLNQYRNPEIYLEVFPRNLRIQDSVKI